MKRINLTIERIKKAAPSLDGKVTFLWDAEQGGLGVKIAPTGFKTYIYQYRFLNKPAQKKIGGVAQLSLQQARAIAQDYAYELKKAERERAVIDPLKDLGVPLPSFYEVAKEYLEYRKRDQGKQRKAANSTMRDWKYMVEGLNKQRIGKMPIKAIKMQDASNFFAGFSDRPTHGNRIKSLVSLVFHYAIKKGYRESDNIWRYIDNYKEKPKRPRLLENKENLDEDQPTLFLRYMKEAMEGKRYDKKGFPVDPAWIGMMLLNYFTGARPGELQNIKITDINRQEGVIYKSETKTGEKEIFLNKKALEVIDWSIKNIRRVKDNPYLFAGMYGRGYRATWRGRPWISLQEATGITAPPYALRRHFATEGKRIQLKKGKEGDLDIIAKIMAHASKEMTELYAGDLKEEVERLRALIKRENDILGESLSQNWELPISD